MCNNIKDLMARQVVVVRQAIDTASACIRRKLDIPGLASSPSLILLNRFSSLIACLEMARNTGYKTASACAKPVESW